MTQKNTDLRMQMSPDETLSQIDLLTADLYISSLLLDRRMGGRRIRKILSQFEQMKLRDFFFAEHEDLIRKIETVIPDPSEIGDIRDVLSDPALRDMVLKNARSYSSGRIRSVNRDDSLYPSSLRGPEGMPLVLYGIGDFSLMSKGRKPAVAVVGSRRPSTYGVSVTREITRDLSLQNVTVISGLARGIDTIAHEEALRNKGKTVAVLAGGLDQVYPPENKDLFERICENGLALSEMPPTTQVSRRYFPARNRILSGLSDAVAIMEAGEFSGTLHTASFAALQGREVFVVPGGIYQDSYRGSLLLLRDGAQILLSAEDILAQLAGVAFFREIDEIREQRCRKDLNERRINTPELLKPLELRQIVLEELSLRNMSIDELSQSTGISFLQLAPVISELEMSGSVKGDRQRFALTFPFT